MTAITTRRLELPNPKIKNCLYQALAAIYPQATTASTTNCYASSPKNPQNTQSRQTIPITQKYPAPLHTMMILPSPN